VIREEERRASFARALGDLRERQRRGLLPADLDAGQLLLAIMGLVAYPLAFPQLTRMVTGRSAADASFRADRADFLRRFAAALTGLRPAAAGATA
jgi:TetR/AcrR family transcriptional regulator